MAAGDFIIPDVFADLAQAAFSGKVKVLGSPAVVEDNRLTAQPGERVTFPKWDAIGELDDLDPDVALVPGEMGQDSDASAVVKEAGKAVRIKDRDKLTALGGQGGAQAEAARQFAVLAARKVDGDLIAEAVAKAGRTHVTAAGGSFSWQNLVGLFEKFGDEFEPDEFAGIYINSAQMGEAFVDPQFIDAAKIGDNSIVRRGVIGLLGGIPVQVSDRITAGTVLAMKNAALGALYKRKPIVESDRDILGRADVLTTNVHYAVHAVAPANIGKLTITA
jgi:hypothetical protein